MEENKKRILVVDDEEDICAIVQYHLIREGYNVDVALSAEEALAKGGAKTLTENYDLILLDIMMPGMSGFEFAKMLRSVSPLGENAVSIVFLTAMDGEENVITGLNLGADDYIAKPFSPNVLKARVGAVLRRTNHSGKNVPREKIVFEDLVIDIEQMSLTIEGKIVPTTRRELDLLILFVTHPDKVFSREEILMKVWPDDVCVTERSVDVNITRLRKKMGKYSDNIYTRVGYGYSFKA